MAVEMLTRYKDEVVEKVVVQDVIAEALGHEGVRRRWLDVVERIA